MGLLYRAFDGTLDPDAKTDPYIEKVVDDEEEDEEDPLLDERDDDHSLGELKDAYFGFEDLAVSIPEDWEIVEHQKRVRDDDGFPYYSGPAAFNVYDGSGREEADRMLTVTLREPGTAEGGFSEQIACVVPVDEPGDVYVGQGGIMHATELPTGTKYEYARPTRLSNNDYEYDGLCVRADASDRLNAADGLDARNIALDLPFWPTEFSDTAVYVAEIVPITPAGNEDADFPGVDGKATRVYERDAVGGDTLLSIPSVNDVFGESGVYYPLSHVDSIDGFLVFRVQPCWACDGGKTGFYSYDVFSEEILVADDEFFGVIEAISDDGRYFVSSVDNGIATGFDVYEFLTFERLTSPRPGGGETFSTEGAGCPFTGCAASVRWGNGDGKLYYDVFEWNEGDAQPEFGGDPLTKIDERFVLVPPLD